MLKKLIGMTGDEDTLFETVVFEVESNYDYFKSTAYDIVLKPVDYQQFQIEKVVWRNDPLQTPPNHSEYRKKKYWFCFEGKSNRIILIFCRIDLSTKSATIFQDRNTEMCSVGSLIDPDKPVRPMTGEEIRRGFEELCGILHNRTLAKSKLKKAM